MLFRSFQAASTKGCLNSPNCCAICQGLGKMNSGMPKKPGTTFGQTDDFGWNITEDPVHVHDMQATIMHLCGINHEAHTFRYQGRQFRLTDVHGAVLKGMLA